MTAFPNPPQPVLPRPPLSARRPADRAARPLRLSRPRIWPSALGFALVYLAALVLVVAPGLVPGLAP